MIFTIIEKGLYHSKELCGCCYSHWGGSACAFGLATARNA